MDYRPILHSPASNDAGLITYFVSAFTISYIWRTTGHIFVILYSKFCSEQAFIWFKLLTFYFCSSHLLINSLNYASLFNDLITFVTSLLINALLLIMI